MGPRPTVTRSSGVRRQGKSVNVGKVSSDRGRCSECKKPDGDGGREGRLPGCTADHTHTKGGGVLAGRAVWGTHGDEDLIHPTAILISFTSTSGKQMEM